MTLNRSVIVLLLIYFEIYFSFNCIHFIPHCNNSCPAISSLTLLSTSVPSIQSYPFPVFLWPFSSIYFCFSLCFCFFIIGEFMPNELTVFILIWFYISNAILLIFFLFVSIYFRIGIKYSSKRYLWRFLIFTSIRNWRYRVFKCQCSNHSCPSSLFLMVFYFVTLSFTYLHCGWLIHQTFSLCSIKYESSHKRLIFSSWHL